MIHLVALELSWKMTLLSLSILFSTDIHNMHSYYVNKKCEHKAHDKFVTLTSESLESQRSLWGH